MLLFIVVITFPRTTPSFLLFSPWHSPQQLSRTQEVTQREQEQKIQELENELNTSRFQLQAHDARLAQAEVAVRRLPEVRH